VDRLFVDDFSDRFIFGLFDYDEVFASPCVLNETFYGGLRGKWMPKVMFLDWAMPEGSDDENVIKSIQ